VTISEGSVLICGLGALGQACLERLLRFDVPLAAVDLLQPQWRRAELAEHVRLLVQGDMRKAQVLEKAGVRQCRSVLLLSADSQVNLEAALMVRLLNPDADVVVRSSSGEQAIGQLLEQRLPKVAVVDPLVLTAGAIASAVQPREGLIQLTGRRLRQAGGSAADLWMIRRQGGGAAAQPTQTAQQRLSQHLRSWQRRWRALPRRQLGWLVPLLLCAVASGLVLFTERAGDWRRALLITLGLLQGEFVDPVMLLRERDLWQLVAGLSYALLGTLITSALVALILEHLLTERLGLQRRERLRVGSRQVLIVGGQDVVEPIRTLLMGERIGVQTASFAEGRGGLESQLERLKHTQLVGVGLLSDNLLSNVHAALTLQQSHPSCRLAVLAHALEASDQLGRLLGGISVISGADLAADALVATAFGERVERVLQINGENQLVVRYRVEPNDQLCGLTIARVENG